MNKNNNVICDFGVHKGESYKQLPACFLNWMIGVNHQQAGIAKAELARREQAVRKSVNTINH
ncbi:hypothetical protein [Pseudoalteromonas sp. T1lg10]|uniref:hypothetical protein n=1 Tax=Pseudoalteromonas sp. T1lg10 TaxID=2077093 RepID=UPI000CF68FEF|nr:hypothetical protein [Pseudoalteromonas sp. T1lg10]